MAKFPYSVWFRDHSLWPDHQDYEWAALMLIEADSEDDALAWGNHLAKGYCDRNSKQQFLRSYIIDAGEWDETNKPMAPKVPSGSKVPIVEFGSEATDDEIGW